nr:Chain PQK1, MAAAPQK nascent peptide [Escherichia coli K-12]
MAAAPQK